MAATGALLGAAAISAGAATANSLMSAGASALANYRQYRYSKKLMKYQYNLERQSRQTSYGDTKQSLLSAGYNPILGLTGGQAMPLSPSATASSANSPGFDLGIADAVSAMQAISQNERLKNQNKNDDISMENDTARAENESLESMQRQALTKAQVENQLIKNEVDKATAMDTAVASLENLKDNSALSKQQVRNLQHDIKVGESNIIRNIAEAGQASSAAQYTNLQSRAERDYQDWLDDKNSDSKGENKRPKRGIKYTGYTSRAMGFNPVQAGIQGLVGGAMMKGRR